MGSGMTWAPGWTPVLEIKAEKMNQRREKPSVRIPKNWFETSNSISPFWVPRIGGCLNLSTSGAVHNKPRWPSCSLSHCGSSCLLLNVCKPKSVIFVTQRESMTQFEDFSAPCDRRSEVCRWCIPYNGQIQVSMDISKKIPPRPRIYSYILMQEVKHHIKNRQDT